VVAASVRDITAGEGVDVVCENIGDPVLWTGAFESLAQRGRLVTMGAHGGGKVELDVRKLYGRRLVLIGSAGVTPTNMEQALEAGASGAVKA
jgi:NADPH2:quinone reductase